MPSANTFTEVFLPPIDPRCILRGICGTMIHVRNKRVVLGYKLESHVARGKATKAPMRATQIQVDISIIDLAKEKLMYSLNI